MPNFTYKPIAGNGANTQDFLDFLVSYNNTVTFSDSFFRKAEGPGNAVVLQATGLVWIAAFPLVHPIKGTFDSLRMTNGGDVIWTITNWNQNAEAFFEAALDSNEALRDLVLSGNDVVTGSALGDTLLGGGGADRMSGGKGDDSLSGGDGRDVIYGGRGLNYLTGDAGNDSLYGGTLGDSLVGGDGRDRIVGSGGNDYAYGGNGADLYYGGVGNDVFTAEAGADRGYGGSGKDSMEGQLGNDRLYGGGGIDLLDGGTENDLLVGGSSGDFLFGGAGNDTMTGGAGADSMIGGSGTDVFVFDAAIGADAVDFINGYEAGIDRMDLDNDVFTTAGPIGALAAGRFVLGTTALDANDRIIYNSINGRLWFDADGAGGAAKVAFGLMVPGTILTAGDLLITQ